MEPRLVARVEFREWTRAGTLRAPSFKGLVPDTDPSLGDSRDLIAAGAAAQFRSRGLPWCAEPGTVHGMARAIWSGAISFGLVNIPVKLYSAARKKTVRFHQLDSADNSRIQQKRVNPNTGEEVPYEQLVKGYELSPDRYVVVRPEELESVEPKKTRTIDIEDFVELDQIDPDLLRPPLLPRPGRGRGQGVRAPASGDEGLRQGRDRARGDPIEGAAGCHTDPVTTCW